MWDPRHGGLRERAFGNAFDAFIYQLDLLVYKSQHVGPEAAYIPASVAFCPYHEQERGPIPATGTKRLRIAHILQNPFSLLSNVEIEILQFLRYQSCLASSLNPLLFLSLMTLLSFLVALILS
jgi:hypothetical protein